MAYKPSTEVRSVTTPINEHQNNTVLLYGGLGFSCSYGMEYFLNQKIGNDLDFIELIGAFVFSTILVLFINQKIAPSPSTAFKNLTRHPLVIAASFGFVWGVLSHLYVLFIVPEYPEVMLSMAVKNIPSDAPVSMSVGEALGSAIRYDANSQIPLKTIIGLSYGLMLMLFLLIQTFIKKRNDDRNPA